MGTNLSELLNRVHHSDCVAFMKTLPDNCIDSIVTDPPYHLVSIVKRFGSANARNTPSMDTKEGGIVFDPFAGSGTTLVAAKKNGYKYLGTELTEEYIPIIEARLNATEEEQEEIIDRGWFG